MPDPRPQSTRPAPQPGPNSLPYPVELVEIERRELLPKTLVRILMLLRFADPLTGIWETTTHEIARLLNCGRSTVQKSLHKLRRLRYLSVEFRRARGVHASIRFGGFPLGLAKNPDAPKLRWDRNGAATEQSETPSPPGKSSAESSNRGLQQPKTSTGNPPSRAVPEADGPYNVRNVRKYVNKNVPNVHGKKKEHRSLENTESSKSFTPVNAYEPRDHDTSVVKDLAIQLGELSINDFLAAYRDYGLKRLQDACGIAKQKRYDRKNPLRKSPGAYVRWLLQNGKC